MTSNPETVSASGPKHLLSDDRRTGDAVVRILTLNRPRQRNALDTALLRELTLALESADLDERVRAVVLTGNGSAFCAGGDIKEFAGLPDARERMHRRARHMTRLLTLLPTMVTPVVAAVTGPALGAGAALALATDMVIAGDDLVLGYPEITDSVVPAVVMAGAVRHLGQKLAFQMLTQGRRLNAETALRHGLVASIERPELALEAAGEAAVIWAQVDPDAMRETKRLFYRVTELTVEAGVQAGLDVTGAAWSPRH